MRLFHPWIGFPVQRQRIDHQKTFSEIRKNKNFVFILDNLPFPIIKKNNEVSVLFIMEPCNIKKHYNPEFLKQFDVLISFRKDLKHKRKIESWVPYPLFYKIEFLKGKILKAESFLQISKTKKILKSKTCSFLTSNKSLCKNHIERLGLARFLHNKCPMIDQFGEKQFISDKKTALDSYEYTVVVENQNHQDGFTEKIQDAFLAECMPFYWGCSNLEKYFSKQSFVRIPLKNKKLALKIIQRTIKKNLRKKNLKHILKAKKLVLTRYNIYPACQAWEKQLSAIIKIKKQKIKNATKIIWPEVASQKKVFEYGRWIKNYVFWKKCEYGK